MAVHVPTQLAIASARIAFFSPQVILLERYIWSNYGFYVQALQTHSVIPEDGNLTVPDFPCLTADDQPFGWEPFLSYFPPTMMTAMSVMTFQMAGQHPAIAVRFEMRLNGDLYRKQIAYGPPCAVYCESFDWILIEEDE